MSQAAKKVLYFTVGRVPSPVEVNEIARLSTIYASVQVRSGEVAAESTFGATHLESFDYLAGPGIPTAYSSGNSGVTLAQAPSDINPDQFSVYPATVTLDHTKPETEQLAAVKAELDATTGLAKMTNLAADATVTYASSDATKATVGATGKVTSVAAGSATITATLTTATPVTAITATAATDLVNKTAHGFLHGHKVRITAMTGGTGLSVGTDYFVIAPLNRKEIIADPVNTFKLATSLANALAGTAIDITADGSAMTIVRSPMTSTCVVTVS